MRRNGLEICDLQMYESGNLFLSSGDIQYMIKTLLFTLLRTLEQALMVLTCPCCTGTGHCLQQHCATVQAATDRREEGCSHQQDPSDTAPHLGLWAGTEVTMFWEWHTVHSSSMRGLNLWSPPSPQLMPTTVLGERLCSIPVFTQSGGPWSWGTDRTDWVRWLFLPSLDGLSQWELTYVCGGDSIWHYEWHNCASKTF